MRITKGNTRVVILTDNYAIKIARLGIWRLFKKFMRACLDSRWRRARIVAMADPENESFGTKVQRMLFHGHRANHQEYALWHAHPELPLAPVLGIYGGGLILIMRRGQDVSGEVSDTFRARYRGLGDLDRPCQVCLFADGLRYVDYGFPTAPDIFGTGP